MDSEDYPSLQAPSPYLLGMASLRLPDSEEYPFDSRREPVNKEVSSSSTPEVAIRHISSARHRHSNHFDPSLGGPLGGPGGGGLGGGAHARGILDLFGQAVKDAVNVASSAMADQNDTAEGLVAQDLGTATRLLDTFKRADNRTSIEVELGDELLYRYSFTTSLVYFIAYLLVFAIGLVGNCFVIAVVFRSPRMRTVTNYFIVNLAVADILVIVFCLPATLMSSIFVPWVLGWWMCKCVSYVQGVSVVASVYSLIAVSLDRFLAIWYPLKCQITTRRARGMIVVIWVIACGTTIPWALFFDTVMTPIGDHHEIVMCREVWPNNMSGEMYFLVANLLCCYVLPLVLISLCYVLIWIKVWRRSIPSDSKDAQMERMQQKSKVKVVKMLVVVVILFVLSWLPLYIIFARVKLGGATSPWEEEVVAMATPVAQWLGASNSCINPILYAFLSDNFRKAFWKVVSCGTPQPLPEQRNGRLLAEKSTRTTATTTRANGSSLDIL